MSKLPLRWLHANALFRSAGVIAAIAGSFVFSGHSIAQTQEPAPVQIPAGTGSHHVADINALPPAPGLIFDRRAGEYIMFDELVRRLSDRKYILIGEKHDNPIHHHHQSQLIDALTKSDQRHRAVVWEMFTRDQQGLLDQSWQEVPISDLGQALEWEERGWPSWHDYAPIAEIAKTHDLTMVAGNLPDDLLRPIIAEGTAALPATLATKLSLPDMPDEIMERFRVEMAESHCNALPKSMLGGFSTVQFARDASLARAMTDIANTADHDGAFLIAGAMHVRHTIAVPWHISRFEPDLDDNDIAVVSLIEADDPSDNPPKPQDYAERFGNRDDVDFMWFTNDMARKDPCIDLTVGQ
ncbi:ChaN family lipoprotein [Thalassospira povalilytica]|uniref:ChaN family lipoprotein n=1 Tax=Thalassospira povalilytica TaxID=732237 RepID=UPI001D1839D2|nr:ChaN family lipoprotein [Thalassospira povalilytica]MCC4240320.1 ChaN family lipoprotein [Thalassospira povalilytica]